jgi:hypothetical protein
VWLPAAKGKGLEISGTFSRKSGQVLMELALTNRAMQAMTGFAIQFNKNRYCRLLFVANFVLVNITYLYIKGH